MKRIDEEIETPEEELDLVDLMKRMEANFNQGAENLSMYNNTPGEELGDSYESDSYHVPE